MAKVKASKPRSEIRSTTDGKANYIVTRFWDDKNNNWEYQVYAEVVAKDAARSIAAQLAFELPGNNANSRTIWNSLWDKI